MRAGVLSRSARRAGGVVLLSGIPLLLSGCENGGDAAVLRGSWITEMCERGMENELPGFDDYWVQGVFDFTSGGRLEVGRNLYTDADCLELDTEVPPGVEDDSTDAFWQDLGDDPRSARGNARGIRITVKSGSLTVDAEGLYRIDGSRACFSETFGFHASGVTIDSRGDATRIDERWCLRRYE